MDVTLDHDLLRPSDPARAPSEGREAPESPVRDQAEIDRELRLIDVAVTMVRRGVARRVTLTGLPLAHELGHAAQSRAALHHLRGRQATDVEGGAVVLIIEEAD